MKLGPELTLLLVLCNKTCALVLVHISSVQKMPKASPVRKQIKLVILLSRAQVFKMFLKKVQQKFVYMCS